MGIDIRSENGAAIAVLSGEIDHHSARDMRAELDRFIITMQPELMAMDFGGITFMDSSGVGLIMGRSKLLRECGGRLEIHNLSGLERIVKIR